MAEEEAYPYTTVPNRMKEILGKVPSLGKPPKITQAWFKGQGYTSGNDMTVLATMRKLGMVSNGGEPTDFYDALRGKDRAAVAEHVRSAYRPLFELYPDAQQKDAEALQNFFRSTTSSGVTAQRLMVRTFQVLSEFGDFQGAGPASTVPSPKNGSGTAERTPAQVVRSAGGGLTLNVNIQLQLPPSAEGDVYDKLFEAMGKHLKGLASIE